MERRRPKKAILTFAEDTTEKSSPKYVEPKDRVTNATKNGWIVISMKDDRKRVFAFGQ